MPRKLNKKKISDSERVTNRYQMLKDYREIGLNIESINRNFMAERINGVRAGVLLDHEFRKLHHLLKIYFNNRYGDLINSRYVEKINKE